MELARERIEGSTCNKDPLCCIFAHKCQSIRDQLQKNAGLFAGLRSRGINTMRLDKPIRILRLLAATNIQQCASLLLALPSLSIICQCLKNFEPFYITIAIDSLKVPGINCTRRWTSYATAMHPGTGVQDNMSLLVSPGLPTPRTVSCHVS